MVDLSNWDSGDVDAARVAYAQHVREQAMAADTALSASPCCPDCGPFTGAWYPGDLDAACQAHAQHAEYDWRMLA